jgi:hypothetical protein
MTLLRSICIVCLLLSGMPTPAQNSKQQAKELFDRARTEDNDRARQVQDYCQAAQLDPKEKKYSDTCNNYRGGLIHDDTAFLASAISLYKNHDMDRAESMARQVTNYDPKLSGQAKVILDAIKNDRLQSQSQLQSQLLSQVKAAWDKGDFNAVTTLSQKITNPDLKTNANTYVNNVSLYNGYVDQADKLQKDNPQGAVKQLQMAVALNQNGPGNLAAKIAALQQSIAAKKPPPPPTTTPKSAPDSSAEIARKVNKLLADARNAEKQGNSPDALSDYAMVLKIQPGNQEAQSSTARLEQAIKSDPAAAMNELKSAIRYFYQGQFDDARRALMDYLESPQTAQNPGVADFYLGATLIERSILRTPRAQWHGPSPEALAAFKAARKANYSPVRAYVSPALLKIWDSTAP